METVFVVRVKFKNDFEYYYAGVTSEAEARVLAAQHGHDEPMKVKQDRNVEGVKPGEWRQMRVG